jgi:hypothetical protein
VSCRRAVLLVLLVLVGVAAGAPVRADRDAATIGHAKHLGHAAEPGLLVRALRRSGREDWGRRAVSVTASSPAHSALGPRAGVRNVALDVRSVDTLPGHWGAAHLTL